jgi:ribose transport system permease protein
MIWVALVVLLLLCVAFEPSTLKSSAILSMLPFASILAIAAVGQCLVIQQGGIDFSVVGSITLAAVIVTGHAAGDNGKLPEAIAMALVAVMIAGLINGIAVTQLRITPIIATLATNALLIGAVQSYTNGVPKAASDGLSEFAIDKTFGIPHTVYIAAVFVIVAAVVLSKTTLGRRFVVIGANPDAAKAVGLRVSSYVIGTYMLAALCYGAAGIVLAGYVKSPGTTAGNPYLLSTITAVVIGGTALGGGRGRIVGAGIAAVFLCQLEAFISAIGAPASVSLLVQSAAIAIAVGFSSNEVAAALRRSFTALKPGPRQRGYRRAPGGAG